MRNEYMEVAMSHTQKLAILARIQDKHLRSVVDTAKLLDNLKLNQTIAEYFCLGPAHGPRQL